LHQDPPDSSTRLRVPGRNFTKADILVYDLGAGRGAEAVKDYGPRSFLVRNSLGRWLVRRECRAYEAVRGVGGCPEFLGRRGRFALATRWIDAVPLADLGGDLEVPEGTFARLETILDTLHHRGVAHADLHHRDVLVSDDGEVWVVDFAMAWVLGSRPGPLRRWVFARARDSDRVSLARMRARFRGGDVDAMIRAVGERAARWHGRGRRIRGWIDRLRGRERD
jgi:hypothetical protein